jgi:hypothetical protein
VHKPGKLNANADALSRINALEEVNEPETIDENTKARILQEHHDSVLGGHRGMTKTYDAIRKHYRWHNMSEIEDYVKRCAKCQLNKTLRPYGRAPMEITTTARQPFQRCALDIVGPLTETTSGNKYILTFQDDLSKYLVAVPFPNRMLKPWLEHLY